jgi:hypothetical protein
VEAHAFKSQRGGGGRGGEGAGGGGGRGQRAGGRGQRAEGRDRWISEFETSLVCKAISRTACLGGKKSPPKKIHTQNYEKLQKNTHVCLVITFQTSFRKINLLLHMSFTRTEHDRIPGKITHNHVHKSLSILQSPTGVIPNLKIDAGRYNPKQNPAIQLSHPRRSRSLYGSPSRPQIIRMSWGSQTTTCSPHPHTQRSWCPGTCSQRQSVLEFNTKTTPSGHRQSSSVSRPRATPEALCSRWVSRSRFLNLLPPQNYQAWLGLSVSSPVFPSGFDLSVALQIRSIHCGPQPLPTSRTAPPPLSRLRLRTHAGGSLSQEPPGRPVSCRARLSLAPRLHQRPLGWGGWESAACYGLWPRAGVHGCVSVGCAHRGALRLILIRFGWLNADRAVCDPILWPIDLVTALCFDPIGTDAAPTPFDFWVW